MSEELRAVIEAECEELRLEFEAIQRRWKNHEISTGDAIQMQCDIRSAIIAREIELAH